MQRRIIFLAYFFVCVSSFAQQYSYVHYTPKNGLVNSRVRKAYQDSKGRMYFLTFGGLSVYDGARFKNYTTADGLASDLVNDIIEVGDDSLLIAPNTGILNTLVKGKISRLNTQNNFCPVINYFYQHSDKSIYLACDEGLFQLEKNNISRLNIFPLTKDSARLPFLGNITGLGNYLFICTNDLKGYEGLYLYDIKNNRICDSLREGFIHPIGKNRNNQVWINTSDSNHVVDVTSLSQGKLKLVPAPIYSDFRKIDINDILFDNNNAWILYHDNLLNNGKSDIEENKSVLYLNIPEEIRSSDIRSALLDKENTIWLCSNGGGVFKIVRSPLKFFENPIDKNLKIFIYALYYSSNAIWYSSNKDKLYRKIGSEVTEFRVNLKQSPAIFFANNRKIIGNDAQNVFEATINNSVKEINFRKIISLPDSTYFTSRRIVDKYDAIIAGIKGGLGVWKNDRLVYFLELPQIDLADGLVFDKNDLLWMATRYSGIKVFSLHPEEPSQYLETVYDFDKSQIEGSPRCIEIDKTGSLWVGTRDHGLYMYQREGKQLKELAHFTTANGMTDNFVVSLACDSSNNIIAGTQTGVDRIIRSSDGNYQIENLTKTNNYFSYISDVWVGADEQGYARTFLGGLIMISPTQSSNRHYVPHLLLEEIRVNATRVSEKDFFSYKQNNLSFLVSAPSFIDENQVRYSYLLKGSGNNQWSDTSSTNATINLTNLSAGKYTLNVKAFFPSNMYPPAELSYPFEITPPWWSTWWFKIIVGAFIVAVLIVGFRFYYNRRLEKQMAILEKQQAIEKERTRIATDMHDDLGAGLSRIKFLSQSILNKKGNDEVVTGELEKITSFSDEMSEKMGEIIWALNEKNDTLADLVAYTRSYTMEYLANHNIECEADTPLHLPASFITGEMRRNIFLSVKECLHNIVKHSQATKVFFSVQLNGMMQIVIHDNGKGIDLNNQRAFSNGIENLKKRMKEIEGSVSFTNDKGTKVSLTIPLIL